MLTVELWGANADLYEFVGGVDQMEARLWVTVEKMPMTVTACSFEAEYNGSDNFQNVKLTDATLACAYDTDSPYLTDPIGAGLTANGCINPQRNDVLNVQWEDGKPAANEKAIRMVCEGICELHGYGRGRKQLRHPAGI